MIGFHNLAVSEFPTEGDFRSTSGTYAGTLKLTFEPLAVVPWRRRADAPAGVIETAFVSGSSRAHMKLPARMLPVVALFACLGGARSAAAAIDV